MAVQEKVESNGGIITLRLIRCGVGTNRALDMGITNKAFDAYEQSLIRVRAFLTSLRGWRSKTRPMKKSCLCAPCSPSCTVATQRNSSPRNISSPVRSGWRRINSSTRSSLRGGKRCFRRSRCLPRGLSAALACPSTLSAAELETSAALAVTSEALASGYEDADRRYFLKFPSSPRPIQQSL